MYKCLSRLQLAMEVQRLLIVSLNFIGVEGMTETLAPVLTWKRRPKMESYMNGWVLCGPTVVEITVGPAAHFSGF